MDEQEHLTQLFTQCGVDAPEETARALIARFGSLPAMAEAFSLRMTDRRLTPPVQMLLGMVPGVCRQRMLDRLGLAPRLSCFASASQYAAALYVGAHHERIHLLCLDENLSLTKQCPLTEGGLKEIVFSPRLLLREAIKHHARAIILCHNHPSGRAHFSEADVSSTRALLELCSSVNIATLDHLLVAASQVMSMRRRLYIPERLWMSGSQITPAREEWLEPSQP